MHEMTDVEHWDANWATKPSAKLPSGLVVGTRNLQRLLRRHIKPGMQVLEAGCAPGKMLAWVDRALGAKVAGLDYSPRGAEVTRWLLGELHVQGDIRCESIFSTSFGPATFDVVYSAGLVEHFEDPHEIIAAHLRLVRRGGVALIIIPNYGGVYGLIQRYLDAPNLKIHNLEIMNERALYELAPSGTSTEAKSYRFGSISPWMLSLQRKWGIFGIGICYAVNAIALLQPVDINALCPLLVLELRQIGE